MNKTISLRQGNPLIQHAKLWCVLIIPTTDLKEKQRKGILMELPRALVMFFLALQGWRAERTRGPGTELCMLFFPTPLSLHSASFMVQIHLTAFQHLESDMFVLESLYRQQEEIAASSKQFS